METSVHRYAVAIVLPDSIAARFDELRARYSLPPWEPRLPWHITLVPPFTKRLDTDDIDAMLRPVATTRKPFPITIAGFGRFDNRHSVAFAHVEPHPELVRLAEDAAAALPGIRRSHDLPFKPHVTLAREGSRGTIDDYLAKLVAETLHGEFICDRFSLLRLDEVARQWDVVQAFPFTP